MSQQTIAPVKYVPYIVLYIDGRPFMTYSGPASVEEIGRFIVQTSQNMPKQQPFTQDRSRPQSGPPGSAGYDSAAGSQEPGIPAYTIGHPVKGGKNDMVCYVLMKDAYKPTLSGMVPENGQNPRYA
jgi:hypothetical protein